ncbi:MAG: SEC-C domain-containing protein [Isosphaeraceae bacterium]
MEPQRPVEEGSSGELEIAAEADLRQEAPPDARGLVGQMVAAGEWPEPTLVERILAAGDAAVEPLREVLKTRPLGWPAEAPIVHAAGILGMLRPPSALPDLIELARFYKNETGQVAGDAIATYGPEGFDTLLELIGDPSITGYHRTYFIDSAKIVAGEEPVLRARLAELLRQVFTRVAGEVKERVARQRAHLVSENEERDDAELAEILGKTVEDPATEEATQPGDDEELEAIRRMDADNETGTYEALSLLASDLCDLADPLARDMLQSAFDEDLIDESIIDRKTAWQIYDEGGETFGPNTPWFQEYSESYLEEQSDRERLARTPQVHQVQFPSRTSYPSFSPGRKEAPPAPIQPIEPFRYTAPKIGRNDPCWCGSGKKYKRCHLGKDALG